MSNEALLSLVMSNLLSGSLNDSGAIKIANNKEALEALDNAVANAHLVAKKILETAKVVRREDGPAFG